MRTRIRTTHSARVRHQVHVAAMQTERLPDPHPGQRQHRDQQLVAHAPSDRHHRQILVQARRRRLAQTRARQPVQRPRDDRRQVLQPRHRPAHWLHDLIQQPVDRARHRSPANLVAIKAANGAHDVADPIVAPRPPVTATPTGDRCRPQMQLKHPQIPRARNQIPKQPALPRPPRELHEIRRVLPRRPLRPIPAHPLLEQEPVEHRHQLEPLVDDRPVPHPGRQINTLPLEKANQGQPQHHDPRTPRRNRRRAHRGYPNRAPRPIAASRRPTDSGSATTGRHQPSDQIEHHPSNSASKQPRLQHHSTPTPERPLHPAPPRPRTNTQRRPSPTRKRSGH